MLCSSNSNPVLFSFINNKANLHDTVRYSTFRPTSLAWEVRKSSPGKTLAPSPVSSALSPSDRSSVSPSRSLDFESSQFCQSITPADQTLVSQNSTNVEVNQDGSKGLSWADKVKGSPKATVSRTTQTSNGTPPHTNNSTSSGVTCISPRVQDVRVKDLVVVEDPNGEESDEGGWETVHRGKKSHRDSAHRQLPKRNYHKAYKENIAPSEHRFSSNTPSVDSCAVKNGQCERESIHNRVDRVKTAQTDSTITKIIRSRNADIDDDVLAVPLDYNDIEQEFASTSDVERDKAISDVIKQEESVSEEREKWHEQAIAAAIAHEEVSV